MGNANLALASLSVRISKGGDYVENLGKLTLLSGAAVAIFAQIVGAGVAFRASFTDGVLSLIVPGYLLFTLNRSQVYWKIVGTWMVGILGIVLGTILLS